MQHREGDRGHMNLAQCRYSIEVRGIRSILRECQYIYRHKEHPSSLNRAVLSSGSNKELVLAGQKASAR